jgi:hypothetical protein
MPLFVPVIGWAVGALGAAAVAKLLVREWRRVNDQLHPRGPVAEAAVPMPKLRRDPISGVYRPE